MYRRKTYHLGSRCRPSSVGRVSRRTRVDGCRCRARTSRARTRASAALAGRVRTSRAHMRADGCHPLRRAPPRVGATSLAGATLTRSAAAAAASSRLLSSAASWARRCRPARPRGTSRPRPVAAAADAPQGARRPVPVGRTRSAGARDRGRRRTQGRSRQRIGPRSHSVRARAWGRWRAWGHSKASARRYARGGAWWVSVVDR